MTPLSDPSTRAVSARRRAYLRFCIRVSLRKRLPNLLLASLLGACLGLLLHWPWWGCVMAMGTAWAVSALIVAYRSWQRHRDDQSGPDTFSSI